MPTTFHPDTSNRMERTAAIVSKGTRAKYVELAPNEHDQIHWNAKSFTPYYCCRLVKSGEYVLINHSPGLSNQPQEGFRDITRIASSDPRMWTDILLSIDRSFAANRNLAKNKMDRKYHSGC